MKRLDNISQQLNPSKTNQIVYSVAVGPKVKGESRVHRNPVYKDKLMEISSDINSLADFWDRSVKLDPSNKLVEDLTFTQVDEMARRVGSWIIDHVHKLFFLYCVNCPNWTICDVASMNYGLVNVPLYDTLGPQAFNHILKITEGTLMFTTNNLAKNLCNYLSKGKYNISEVCFFNQVDAQYKQKLQQLGLKVSTFSDALSYSKIKQRPKLNLDSVLTLGFTSGTTGIPKGVIYSHRMVFAQCLALKEIYQYTPTDVHLSYLPIAHSFERLVNWICIMYGANIRYAKHPITEIVKDFAISKPTALAIVPRLLNKFYPLLKSISDKEGNFNKAKAIFGGRVRMMVTGSAPVAPAILSFYQQALGADTRQGYGQTESVATFVTGKGDTNYGHVGGPNNAVQFKLVDVPEMNYFSDGQQPRGQICFRGISVFSKYFKDPKNTEETVDKDGWNHSGDIGIILPNGAIKIIDRKKNIYKLQQGQYIAPEKVQNIYARCKFVAESFVYGDSLKNCNVAIVHPNLDALPVLAQNLGIQEKDVSKLCENPKINKFILDEITKQGKNDGLMSFQQAKKIKLWPIPFQMMGILTSSMKLQRYIAKDKFKKQIEQLYK